MARIKFLMGTEEGEKQDFLEKEKAMLRKEHPDLDVVQLFAFEVDAPTLDEALYAPSLFASHTMVILRHYEELRKDSPVNKTILGYIKADVDTSSLYVLSSGSGYSLPAAISKALGKDGVINFWEMFENRKQDWVRGFFRKEGWSIDGEAIRYILDMIENNTL